MSAEARLSAQARLRVREGELDGSPSARVVREGETAGKEPARRNRSATVMMRSPTKMGSVETVPACTLLLRQ